MEPLPLHVQVRTTSQVITFVAEGNSAIQFQLICRMPGRNYDNEFLRIYINGDKDLVAEMEVRDKWTKYSFSIDPGLIKDGVNKLVLSWPYTNEPLNIKGLISPNSLSNALFPVLGEIHAFNAFLQRKEILTDRELANVLLKTEA